MKKLAYSIYFAIIFTFLAAISALFELKIITGIFVILSMMFLILWIIFVFWKDSHYRKKIGGDL